MPRSKARSKPNVRQTARLFRLLGDATRLRLLTTLASGELNVSQLCLEMRLRQPAVSHHLGLLRAARLVQGRRSGKEVFYRLTAAVASKGGKILLESGGAVLAWPR